MKHSLLRLPLFVLGLVTAFSLAGCNSVSSKKDYPVNTARFFMEASDGDAYASAVLPISGVKLSVNSKPVVTEFDIVHVDLANSDMGQFLVFQLTPDAARDLYRITGDHQGRRLMLAINGRALGARLIERPFDSGSIAIFAEVPADLLPEMVKNLNLTSADIQKEIAKQKS